MPKIHRRQFLQFSASTLAALGLNPLEIQRQGLRYARAIAGDTSRKLALLVGANGYRNLPLKGCLTDVTIFLACPSVRELALKLRIAKTATSGLAL